MSECPRPRLAAELQDRDPVDLLLGDVAQACPYHRMIAQVGPPGAGPIELTLEDGYRALVTREELGLACQPVLL